MDALGHVLLGIAVSGELTPFSVVCSLLPDISAIPLQLNKNWKNPGKNQLLFYRFCHSPVIVFLAHFLPGNGFVLVATHIISDMFTHKEPYSDFPIFGWDYKKSYYFVLLCLMVAACLRLFF